MFEIMQPVLELMHYKGLRYCNHIIICIARVLQLCAHVGDRKKIKHQANMFFFLLLQSTDFSSCLEEENGGVGHGIASFSASSFTTLFNVVKVPRNGAF